MAILSVANVTEYLRDRADFNLLLDARQFSDDEITSAIGYALDKYNIIPPMSSHTNDNFPSKYILLIATAAHLMRSAAHLHLRNHAVYQDGDVENIQMDSKYAAYIDLANVLEAEWRAAAVDLKKSRNMESGYGSLGSGYRYIGGNRGGEYDI